MMLQKRTYSILALFLILAAEILFIIGSFDYTYECFSCALGFLVAIVLLWLLRWCIFKGNPFWVRSKILTRLMANAISPSWIGAFYLLFFIVHLGWLSDETLKLFFIPHYEIDDVLVTLIVIIAGTFFLIEFFPEGKVEKNKGNKFKVFVSGISGLNSVPKELDSDKYNVRPLVRILEETNLTGDDCEFLILLSDFYTKAKKPTPDEETKELQRRWDIIRDTVKLAVPNLDESEFSKLTIEEKLERLIIETAKNEFRERNVSFKKLKIHFTAPCDYEDFPTCFRLLSNEIREFDTKDKEICFNLTPGPASISSIVTLLSIDADRKLYYYSQDDSKSNNPIELVDKTKVPLENLLSQAIETLKQ